MCARLHLRSSACWLYPFLDSGAFFLGGFVSFLVFGERLVVFMLECWGTLVLLWKVEKGNMIFQFLSSFPCLLSSS